EISRIRDNLEGNQRLAAGTPISLREPPTLKTFTGNAHRRMPVDLQFSSAIASMPRSSGRQPISEPPVMFGESSMKSWVPLQNSDFCHKPVFHRLFSIQERRFAGGAPVTEVYTQLTSSCRRLIDAPQGYIHLSLIFRCVMSISIWIRKGKAPMSNIDAPSLPSDEAQRIAHIRFGLDGMEEYYVSFKEKRSIHVETQFEVESFKTDSPISAIKLACEIGVHSPYPSTPTFLSWCGSSMHHTGREKAS
ncbi:hypothetical protein HAX54_042216, partial [Datura stramonium]|nr:hypothetical protein [Datura stramonium]